MTGLGRHYELDLELVGELDATQSYMIDIKEVDKAVRAAALPLLQEACDARPWESPAATMLRFMPPLNAALHGRLDRCRLRLSPFYSWEMSMSAQSTQSSRGPAPLHTASSSKAILRQRFDFAASHRLHVASLSPEENTRLFGKCNLPSGHGHNYMIEPAVEVTLSPTGEPALGLQTLETIVDREIIERFDHRHLNLDTPEFGEQGVNPSVENIARVFFGLLEPKIREAAPGARLAHITVWETDRTSSTYPA